MNNAVEQYLSSASRIPGLESGISLGLGLTNECNLACSFCYRDPTRTDRLSLDQVRAVMERMTVRSVNLGTGENGMHPEFKAILAYLRSKPVKLTITSNGHSVAILEEDELKAFHDIEFSLDYPTEELQDAQRGPGNWALIHQQAERCVKRGIPVTIIAVMMKSNYLYLSDVARIAKRFNAPLRVNVYQAVRSDLYALSYEEYWEGFRRLFEETDAIANRRTSSSRHGGISGVTSGLWPKHCASDSARYDSTLRLLARIGRTTFGFGPRGRRHSLFSALRTGAGDSNGLHSLRIP